MALKARKSRHLAQFLAQNSLQTSGKFRYIFGLCLWRKEVLYTEYATRNTFDEAVWRKTNAINKKSRNAPPETYPARSVFALQKFDIYPLGY